MVRTRADGAFAQVGKHMDIRFRLTLYDVLLQPCASSVLPSQADVSTWLGHDIALDIPILSSAMDMVTEADMAIVSPDVASAGFR